MVDGDKKGSMTEPSTHARCRSDIEPPRPSASSKLLDEIQTLTELRRKRLICLMDSNIQCRPRAVR
jgi:hypothetical protein